jgi:hypothetical protein
MNAILQQVLGMAENKLAVERADVAAAVVRFITNVDYLIEVYEEGGDAGVEAALEDIDAATLCAMSDAISEVATAEVKAQAMRQALLMIRDVAARNGQEMDAPF